VGDVIDYFDAYGSNPTNLIICTTAEQILIVREHHPELYLKYPKPLFIDGSAFIYVGAGFIYIY
jgi:hypothetical protein